MGLVQRHTYRHVRWAYHAFANREYARDRNTLAAVLRNFVKRGDLVFDIGANRGDYTYVLLAIGARVVAVEPNPTLAEWIRARYPVEVEAAAAGSTSGTLPLHLGINPGHSTLSEDWLSRAPTQERWTGDTIPVDVVTLVDLAARYGEPKFMKIDVEGYEADVLAGCNQPPPAMSFEFQRAALPIAHECLALLDGYEFNQIPASATGFTEGWCGASELGARLDTYDSATYGDVYARRST